MDFTLTDEQQMLVNAAQRYVRERCSLESRRSAIRGAHGFSRAQFAQFAEMGWLALPLPEAVGGLGGDAVELALLMEQLGHGLVVEPLVDTAVLCGTLLAQAGASLRRDALLERIVSGDCVLALAHIEPGARSELETDIDCRAVRSGEGWTLNGTKQVVCFGESADHWLVSARVENTPGYAFFIVDRQSAGCALQGYPLIDGTRAADIRFTDVAVPADALLLDGNAAGAALEKAIDLSIIALAAAAIGSMEAVMALTADYLKTRVQYGKPLAQFQALQHRLAEMLVETEQARSMLYRALAVDDATQRHGAVSGAKVLISRAARFVTGQSIQLHGGIGTTDEYATSHHYKMALAFEKRFGDSDCHLRRCRAFAMHT